MADNIDVLRVGNSKPDIESKEQNKKGMSRRDFMKLAGYITLYVASVGGIVGMSYLEYRKSKAPKSIDDCYPYADPTEITDIILNTLSKATKDGVIHLGVHNSDEVSYVHAIIIDPSILEEYYIRHYFSKHSLLVDGNKKIDYEQLTIELCSPPERRGEEILLPEIKGDRYWSFQGMAPLGEGTEFRYHDKYKHIMFKQGHGLNALANIKDLLDSDGHIQKERLAYSNYNAQRPLRHA